MTSSPDISLEREAPAFQPADRLMAAVLCLLAVLFIHSGLEGHGILLWASLSALLITTPFYLRRFKISFDRTAILLFVLLFLFALPRLLFDSTDVYLLVYAVVLPGYLYCVHYVCAGFGRARLPGEAFLLDAGKAIFLMPFSRFSGLPEVLFQKKRSRFGRTIGFILLGLLLAAVPTLIVFVLLLNSDGSFVRLIDSMLDRIFSLLPTFDLSTLLVSLVVGILLAFYVFGHLLACGTHALGGGVSEETRRAVVVGCRFAPIAMVCAAVFPLLMLYLLFFVSQIPYYLGGFSGTLPEGLSYADYARSGFFELCAVALINAAMLCCMTLFTRRETDRLPLLPRIMSILLSLFTVGLISTAIAKMLMYVHTYGLTRRRIYTLWLMGFLAIFFIIQIIHQFCPRLRTAACVFAVAVLFIGIFLFADFDRIIADYNVNAYLSSEHEHIDVEALAELSDSAVPTILRLYEESADETVRRRAEDVILNFLYNDSIRSPLDINLTSLYAADRVRANHAYPAWADTVQDWLN